MQWAYLISEPHPIHNPVWGCGSEIGWGSWFLLQILLGNKNKYSVISVVLKWSCQNVLFHQKYKLSFLTVIWLDNPSGTYSNRKNNHTHKKVLNFLVIILLVIVLILLSCCCCVCIWDNSNGFLFWFVLSWHFHSSLFKEIKVKSVR